MIKKYFFTLLLLGFIIFPNLAQAQSRKATIYFFYSDTCPHCAKEEIFLNQLEKDYASSLEIKRYEVSKAENVELLRDFGEKLNADIRGVPFTVVGEQYFVGFYNEQSTGEQIKLAALSMLRPVEFQAPSFVIPEDKKTEEVIPSVEENDSLYKEGIVMDLPNVAGINLKALSLPLITIVLGVLDGFNPCAMWALLFLISLLLGMKDRKRMWILGTTFIVTSALVYFLFMAAWLNLILFLGFVFWLRLIIALVALGGGVYNVRNFFVNKSGECKVSGGEKKKKVFDKLKEITNRKQFLFAIIGIVLLAIVVNMVELVCSAGLPAVYAQVLTMNNLSTWQYYVYISLYILFFMLDDLLVFFVAMFTLRMTGLSTKYARFSNIVGGVLMILIGLALFFKPEWLMFA